MSEREVALPAIETTSRVDPGAIQPSPAETATRLFIENLRSRVESASADLAREQSSLARREGITFAAAIASGTVSVGLIVGGFILISAGQGTVAVVSEMVGLLAGGGTLGFRQAARDTARRRESLAQRESEDSKLVQAIGVALMIPDDDERNRAIVDLATRLADAVGRKPAVSRK